MSGKSDFYMDVKIYERDVKSGFFKIKHKRLDKGMLELGKFVAQKLNENDVNRMVEELTKNDHKNNKPR